jgi:hypothetical protein
MDGVTAPVETPGMAGNVAATGSAVQMALIYPETVSIGRGEHMIPRMGQKPGTAGSIPITFGILIAIALLLPGRRNPRGIRVRRQFPMACHPLIVIVAPCPVACDPHVAGRRLGQHDLRLERRRRFGHIGGGSHGRCRRNGNTGGVSDGHGGNRVRGRGSGGGRHRAGRRGWRWTGNHLRLGRGRATSQETNGPATCQDRCELSRHADGSRTRKEGKKLCFHFSRIRPHPFPHHGV